ncbi:hypothetical protein [Haloarchaeobius litoreus]|uniref:Uncharacterized protein n=1 Tax=Haloarchaeobius litoreus TaxID=755306 RepID=A0ABD6DHI8_9EURY|nr:hypothetical protein [Haloarchaeobius litoreus]
MNGLVFTYVVTACAMVTASAAVAAAGYLRSVKATVEANEQRSRKNHKLLTGENAPHYEGVIRKVKRLENRGGDS